MSDYTVNSLQDFNMFNIVDLKSFNLHKSTSLMDFEKQNKSFSDIPAPSIFTSAELEILQNIQPTDFQPDFSTNKESADRSFGEILPDVKNNQVFKVTSNPIKEIKDKTFLQTLHPDLRKKVNERKILSLKNANDESLPYDFIIGLALLPDEQWKKVSDRKLLTLKNADKMPLIGVDIIELSKLSDEQWNNVSKRQLLSLKKADGSVFMGFDIIEMAAMTDEQWDNVSKRQLLSYKQNDLILNGWGISTFAKFTDKQWENLNNRKILSLDEIKYETLDDAILDIAGRLSELSDDEWNNSDKKNLIIKELKALTTSNDNGLMTSILGELNGEEFEKTNELIYGKKSPQVIKIIEDFNKSYPDIKLSMNNNVSEEKAKEIIDVVKEFVDNHKNSGLPYTKEFSFINMRDIGGFYNIGEAELQASNKQYLDIQATKNDLRTNIVHENGHYRDDVDYSSIKKEIPEDIKEILTKVLWDYSLTNTLETIAVLTQAIETPDNIDSVNPLTAILHVRKDENDNYYLMLPKYCVVSNDELEKLGTFLRDIRCPEIMPDFDESKHGEISMYNQTLIRETQTFENIAKYIATEYEEDVSAIMARIKDRELLTKNISNAEILLSALVSEDGWKNISTRKLSTFKTKENKTLSRYAQLMLADLPNDEWIKVKDSDLLTGTTQDINEKVTKFAVESYERQKAIQKK